MKAPNSQQEIFPEKNAIKKAISVATAFASLGVSLGVNVRDLLAEDQPDRKPAAQVSAQHKDSAASWDWGNLNSNQVKLANQIKYLQADQLKLSDQVKTIQSRQGKFKADEMKQVQANMLKFADQIKLLKTDVLKLSDQLKFWQGKIERNDQANMLKWRDLSSNEIKLSNQLKDIEAGQIKIDSQIKGMK